ncbi:MAG: hypothetical protein ACK4M7_07855, partial [Burkholderiales bacterium]
MRPGIEKDFPVQSHKNKRQLSGTANQGSLYKTSIELEAVNKARQKNIHKKSYDLLMPADYASRKQLAKISANQADQKLVSHATELILPEYGPWIVKGGHQVQFIRKDKSYMALVDESLPTGFSRKHLLPVYIQSDIKAESLNPHKIHVFFSCSSQLQPSYVYVGDGGLKGGGKDPLQVAIENGDIQTATRLLEQLQAALVKTDLASAKRLLNIEEEQVKQNVKAADAENQVDTVKVTRSTTHTTSQQPAGTQLLESQELLSKLPNETWAYILSFVNPKAIQGFLLSCKQAQAL